MEPEINAATEKESPPRKRVLFVITQSELGGAQQFLLQLVPHLDRKQFSLKVLTGKDGGGALQKLLPPEIEHGTLSHLRRNPHPWREDWQAVFDMRTAILKEKPDILFLMSSKAGFIGFLASLLLGTFRSRLNVIYRIGGWTFNDPWPWWKKKFYTILEKVSSWGKDYIVVNSKHDYELAHLLHIKPRKKLLVIHNGIDPYRAFLGKDEARLKLFERISRHHVHENQGGQASLFHAEYIIGTIANLYPAKDLATFIQASAQLPENSISIIIGEGALRPQLEAQIKDLHLEKRVFLVGGMDEAARFVSAYDVFVLPSVKEGFPWAVLEAMAAKVPVIATAVGAIPEIIESGKNGLIIEPGKPGQLAQAIITLLGDARLRQEIGIQAHQVILKDFSLHKMVEEYTSLFLNA